MVDLRFSFDEMVPTKRRKWIYIIVGALKLFAGRNGGKLQAFDQAHTQHSLTIKACDGALLGKGGVA